jgi:uncharacterized protein
MHISELHVYPIKGAAGVTVKRARLEERGFMDDRRWMIVDDEGVFVSQREYPSLALLQVSIGTDELVVRSARAGEVRVPRSGATGPWLHVRVWDDSVAARDAGDVAAHLISAHIGKRVRLVHMPDSSVRPVDPAFARAGDRVSFADAFPLLLIAQESLDQLNTRLAWPIPILRFRPNIVVADASPHAEDGWRRIRLGTVICDVVKPCARCTTTTVDPATGTRGTEPLRTLATYRTWNQKVYFGQNVIHRALGELAIGDEVTVIESGNARPPLPHLVTASAS